MVREFHLTVLVRETGARSVPGENAGVRGNQRDHGIPPTI